MAKIATLASSPRLVSEHPGELVAYYGEERIAIGPTATELVEKCMQRGLEDDQFFPEANLPEDDAVIDAAMWMHI